MLVKTPNPPYYAVIFTSKFTDETSEYEETAALMEELASKQNGFLGVESARNELGITVSYWDSLEAIKQWKHQTDHTFAREMGREKWYACYSLRICKVERAYDFEK